MSTKQCAYSVVSLGRFAVEEEEGLLLEALEVGSLSADLSVGTSEAVVVGGLVGGSGCSWVGSGGLPWLFAALEVAALVGGLQVGWRRLWVGCTSSGGRSSGGKLWFVGVGGSAST